MSRRGFTLIELLVYIGIFTVVTFGFTSILTTVLNVQSHQTSEAQVGTQGPLLLQQFQYYVESARIIDMSLNSATSTLKLRETAASSSLDPTIISISSGTVYLQQGTGAAQAISSNKVNVTGLTFIRHYSLNGSSTPYGTDSVSYSFTMSASSTNQTQANSQFFQSSATVLAPVPQIALVQQSATSTSNTGITTLSSAFGTVNAAGNLLVAVVGNTTTSASVTLTDSAGNTWKQAATIPYSAYNNRLSIYYAANSKATSTPNTVTATFGSGVGPASLFLYEYRGAATSSVLDTTSTQLQPNTGTPSSGLVYPTSTVELLVGATFNGSTADVPTPGTGFTANTISTVTSVFEEDQNQYVSGPVAATWNYSSSPSSSAIIATFSSGGVGSSGTAGIPSTPGSPTFSSITSTTLSLSWTSSTNATFYQIDRATSSNGTYVQIATTSSLSYSDSGLSPNTTYWYEVAGANVSNVGLFSSAASVTTLNALPGAPGGTTYTNVSSTSVTVNWNSTANVNYYSIQRSATGGNGTFSQVATSVVVSYNDTGLSPNTSYWYYVAGVNASGTGPFNASTSVTTASTPACAWLSTSAMPSYSLNAPAVTYNGYVYLIGGEITTNVATATVLQAPINANGTIGTWALASTSLPTALYADAATAYNGYIYVLGGWDGTTDHSSVYQAQINANGSLGNFVSASTTLKSATENNFAVGYNGYLYLVGGNDGSLAATSSVYQAPVSNNGAVGNWTLASSSLPGVDNGAEGAVYNNHIYVTGGSTAGGTGTGGEMSNVYQTTINANGTLGTWTNASNTLPSAMIATSYASHGYLYAIGVIDSNNNSTSTILQSKINANGSLGAWVLGSSTAPTFIASLAYYNGYAYQIGGLDNNLVTTSSAYYSSCNSGSLPGAPGTPSYTGANTSTVAVNWNAGTDATYYTLSRATSSNGTYNTVSTTPALFFNDFGLSASTPYWYEVAGVNASGTGAFSATSTFTTSANPSSGSLGTWALASSSLPSALAPVTAVSYNGVLYTLGGEDSLGTVTTTIYQATVNANGSLQAWAKASSSLPSPLAWNGAVAYNGYMYSSGGYISGNLTSTVWQAPINGNGSLGTWAKASSSLPTTLYHHVMVAYNGYLYTIGGLPGPETQGGGSQPTSTVYQATINANGSLGNWAKASTTLPFPAQVQPATVYNGLIYSLGGEIGVLQSIATTTIAQVTLNANGSTPAWATASSSLPIGLIYHGGVSYNNRIYSIAGYIESVGATSSVFQATINGNGSLTAWTMASSSLPTAIYQDAYVLATTTGGAYIYTMGGIDSGFNTTSSVFQTTVN